MLLGALGCVAENVQAPHKDHDNQMNDEPSRESLEAVNPNENENAGKEDGSENVGDEWSGVIRKVVGNPPKEKSETRKDQTQQ
jgi:hypothetical protein